MIHNRDTSCSVRTVETRPPPASRSKSYTQTDGWHPCPPTSLTLHRDAVVVPCFREVIVAPVFGSGKRNTPSSVPLCTSFFCTRDLSSIKHVGIYVWNVMYVCDNRLSKPNSALALATSEGGRRGSGERPFRLGGFLLPFRRGPSVGVALRARSKNALRALKGGPGVVQNFNGVSGWHGTRGCCCCSVYKKKHSIETTVQPP